MLTREERNLICYGTDPSYLDREVREGLFCETMGRHDGAVMLAMAILSDAQELLERNNTEECRQFMNRAKYVLGNHVMINK
jgi:hypothetical protein